LAIELDGQSHAMGDRPARDTIRDTWLAARGIETIRIPATEVLKDPQAIADGLVRLAKARIVATGK
jgi:very-short-patch-repair endonuclease